MDIINLNRDYWTHRAVSYSAQNRAELFSDQKEKWQDYLCETLKKHFPDKEPEQLNILETGTGPGFLSIILAEAGYNMTAIDLTPAMLKKAKENAGEFSASIKFIEMNAEDLQFFSNTFDAVVTRNLTWDLPHPDVFYKEIYRVLKPGGMLINFDANWYRYLFDEEAMTGFEEDRENAKKKNVEEMFIIPGGEKMEDIARRIPMSKALRPGWDIKTLSALGMKVKADETIFDRVWTDEEKINFRSTPLFVVKAVK